MNLPEAFLQNLQRYSVQGQRLLLAVSGGLDSVVLCRLSHGAGLSFAIAHCNFNLRGNESQRDEAFVRSLAASYDVPFFLQSYDTAAVAAEQKISIQEAARNLRYVWFEEVRKANGFAYTLLAHHADDNIETVLFNFLRGTGLEGLTGMPEQKEGALCLRPLLNLRRKDIAAFAQQQGLTWVEDSSNRDNHYSRNLLRNDILPQLRQLFPAVEENLLHNIDRFRSVQPLYAETIAALKKKLCEPKGEELHIPVLKLMKYRNTSLIFEIIRDYGFGEGTVGELMKLAEAESGRYIANDRFRIIRHRRWFIIAPVAGSSHTIVIEKDDEVVLFGQDELHLRRVRSEKISFDPSPQVAQLDAKDIAYPLVLRKWKAGDYFYPLGMQKKKKLARFFIDRKLSKTEKEKLWVLESHKRIVWVVGQRIDDRFKCTDKTRELLLLTQKPQGLA